MNNLHKKDKQQENVYPFMVQQFFGISNVKITNNCIRQENLLSGIKKPSGKEGLMSY
jgi:hypothetical protein